MTDYIKKAGSIYYFLSFLLFILFSLVSPSLAARGSGEFSEEYKNDLRLLFEEYVFKIELEEMNGLEAKAGLALLRDQYRVEYNDFAGKADALIDAVQENQQKADDALRSFIIIQNELIVMRERLLKENTSGINEQKNSSGVNPSPSGGGSVNPGKRN